MKFATMFLLAVSLLGTGALSAQTSKGTLAGVARDATGAVVPGATLTIQGEQTGETRTVTTNGEGAFRVESLSPEPYTIMAAQPGFSKFRAEHVPVSPSVVTSYSVLFTVGSAQDTVTVEAEQAGVNTESGQLAGVINGQEIRTLPTLSLNPYELALTVPGVQQVNTDSQLSNGQNFQVNGARPRSNNFLLDSQEINDVGIGGQAFQPQIVDMYDNLTVITSTASAEYGRAGGGIFNLTTRAGSNVFHGTVYDRYAGSGLNSRPASLRGTGTSNARFNTHTIGFTAGGYLWKDKLFAFGGAQFLRYYGKESIDPVLLPDAAGIATLNSLTNPTAVRQVATLKTYLMNYNYLSTYTLQSNLPGTPINIGALQGCTTTAQPSCSVSTSYFQRPFPAELSPDTQWTYRIDFKPTQKDTFYVRYLHDRGSLTPDFFANAAGGALGLDTYQGGPSELGAGSWTHVFTPNILNEFRASETRISFLFAPTAATLANPVYALPTLNLGSGLPALGPSQSFPQGRAEDLYQVQDSFTLIKGNHTIRLGFDVGRQIEKDTVPQNAGTGNFSRLGTSGLGNFLQDQLGNSGTITRSIGPTRVDPHGWRSGVFAQDDVKFKDLTVNLGLRYDYTTNPINSVKYPGIDPNNPFQSITAVIPVKNDYNNISPRIGFAYSPSFGGFFGSGKTSVRGGFGIFYDSYFSNIVTNAAVSAPNSASGTLTQTATTGPVIASTNLSTFVPTLSPLASVTSAVVNNLVNPQTYQYNLGVEQQVTPGVVLGVRYIGNLGQKLFANQQYNYFNGVTGARLNTTRGVVTARGNFASSNYNGLQVDSTIRVGRTINIRANYVFSKDLDNGSEIFALSDNGTSYGANLAPGGRYQDYGPSTYDHRHFFSVSYTWSPKGFHSANKLGDFALNTLTRNFTVSGFSQLQSGAYGTFSSTGYDTNGDGSSANDRPIIGNPGAPLQTAGIDGALIGFTPGVYYDMADYNNSVANPKQVTANDVHFLVPYGPANQFLSRSIGRNSFLNPGSTFHNVAVQKGFGGLPHFERGQLVLRAEVQNIANHNDRGPYLDSAVTDFGVPTSINTDNLARGGLARTLVLWGKFVF